MSAPADRVFAALTAEALDGRRGDVRRALDAARTALRACGTTAASLRPSRSALYPSVLHLLLALGGDIGGDVAALIVALYHPVHRAVAGGDPRGLAALAAAPTSDGRSLLHLAAALGNGEVVRLVLTAAPGLAVVPAAGQLPVETAAARGHWDCAATLAGAAAATEADAASAASQRAAALVATYWSALDSLWPLRRAAERSGADAAFAAYDRRLGYVARIAAAALRAGGATVATAAATSPGRRRPARDEDASVEGESGGVVPAVDRGCRTAVAVSRVVSNVHGIMFDTRCDQAQLADIAAVAVAALPTHVDARSELVVTAIRANNAGALSVLASQWREQFDAGARDERGRHPLMAAAGRWAAHRAAVFLIALLGRQLVAGVASGPAATRGKGGGRRSPSPVDTSRSAAARLVELAADGIDGALHAMKGLGHAAVAAAQAECDAAAAAATAAAAVSPTMAIPPMPSPVPIPTPRATFAAAVAGPASKSATAAGAAAPLLIAALPVAPSLESPDHGESDRGSTAGHSVAARNIVLTHPERLAPSRQRAHLVRQLAMVIQAASAHTHTIEAATIAGGSGSRRPLPTAALVPTTIAAAAAAVAPPPATTTPAATPGEAASAGLIALGGVLARWQRDYQLGTTLQTLVDAVALSSVAVADALPPDRASRGPSSRASTAASSHASTHDGDGDGGGAPAAMSRHVITLPPGCMPAAATAAGAPSAGSVLLQVLDAVLAWGNGAVMAAAAADSAGSDIAAAVCASDWRDLVFRSQRLALARPLPLPHLVAMYGEARDLQVLCAGCDLPRAAAWLQRLDEHGQTPLQAALSAFREMAVRAGPQHARLASTAAHLLALAEPRMLAPIVVGSGSAVHLIASCEEAGALDDAAQRDAIRLLTHSAAAGEVQGDTDACAGAGAGVRAGSGRPFDRDGTAAAAAPASLALRPTSATATAGAGAGAAPPLPATAAAAPAVGSEAARAAFVAAFAAATGKAAPPLAAPVSLPLPSSAPQLMSPTLVASLIGLPMPQPLAQPRHHAVVRSVSRDSPLWQPLRALAGTAAWHRCVLDGLLHARAVHEAEEAAALFELGMALLGSDAAPTLRLLASASSSETSSSLLHIVAACGPRGPFASVRLRIATTVVRRLALPLDGADSIAADTPLLLAVRAQDPEMVALLVGGGAGPLIANLEGITAMEQVATAIADCPSTSAAAATEPPALLVLRALLTSPHLVAPREVAASGAPADERDGDGGDDDDVDVHVRRAFAMMYDSLPLSERATMVGGTTAHRAPEDDEDDGEGAGAGDASSRARSARAPAPQRALPPAAIAVRALLERFPALHRLRVRADDPCDALHRRVRSVREWVSVPESELPLLLFLAVDAVALARGLRRARKKLRLLEARGRTAEAAYDELAEEVARLEELERVLHERAATAAAATAAEADGGDGDTLGSSTWVRSTGASGLTAIAPPPPSASLRRETSGFEDAWSAPLPPTAFAWSGPLLRRDSSAGSGPAGAGHGTPPPPSTSALRRTSTRIVRQLLRLATPSTLSTAATAEGGAAGRGVSAAAATSGPLREALSVLGSLPPSLRPIDAPGRPYRETARSLLYRYAWPGQGTVVLKEPKAAGDTVLLERELQAQLALTARIRSHDNICLPLGFGPVPGRPTALRLAYPFYELGSLRDYLSAHSSRGECLSLRVKLRLLGQVARALAYLNDQTRATGRLVLLNLHSGNVLLAGSAAEPTAKIADFAFCRLLDSGTGTQSLPVNAAGVAPETLTALLEGGATSSASGGGASGPLRAARRPPVGSALARLPTSTATSPTAPVDERVDCYHFGAMIHEVLSQRPPFEGASPTHIIAVAVQRRMQLAGMATLRQRLCEAGVPARDAAARAAESATAEALVALGLAPSLSAAAMVAAAAVGASADLSTYTPPRLFLTGGDAVPLDSPLRLFPEPVTVLGLMERCLADDPALRPSFVELAETLAALQPGGDVATPPHLMAPSELVHLCSVVREEVKPGAASRLYEALDSPAATAAILPMNVATGRHEWALQGALADFVRESAAAGASGDRGSTRRYATTRVTAFVEAVDNAKKHRVDTALAMERHDLTNSIFHCYLPIVAALHRYLQEQVDVTRLPAALVPLVAGVRGGGR